jgi:hypothetical protein
MTDLPVNLSASADSTGRIATVFERVKSLIRAARGALVRATARNAHRRALRRMPDEILAAHVRREEARRAVDKLLLMR